MDPATLAVLVKEVGPWFAFSAFMAWEMREVRRERRRERTTWRESIDELTSEVRGLRSDFRRRPERARADGGDERDDGGN